MAQSQKTLKAKPVKRTSAPVKPLRRPAARSTDKPRRARAVRSVQPAPEMTDTPQDAELRAELIQELEAAVKRLMRVHPGYHAPAFAPQKLIQLVGSSLDKLSPDITMGILSKLRESVGSDFLDVDTWKGMWQMLNFAREYQVDLLARRVTGDYETDEWGYDQEYMDAVLPFYNFMYQKYWRVEMTGVENVPEAGRGLLVSNHSGQLPWDGVMLATGMLANHPQQRLVRALYATWFPTLPVIADIFVKCGGVLATDDNGIRLLEQDQLVSVYPEGYKGVGKLYKDRYKLARFGRGGFVKMAIKTHAPLIPVAVVGAEETYISLAKSDVMAKLTGFPYFPLSPTFPWLGLAGFIPLPTKWYIDIGEPISTEEYEPSDANNLMLVSQLTDQTRNAVQEMIYARLSKRRSVFLG